MNNLFKNERGSSLLIALALMGMLSLLAIMALKNANTSLELSFDRFHSDESFYIAEAGAKRAYVTIRDNPVWDSGFVNVAFGTGNYTVNVTDSSDDAALDDTIVVTSTGQNEYASSTIEMLLVPQPYHPFRAALFADSSVDIRNSMETDSYNSDSGSYWTTVDSSGGDVGSNGTIEIKNGAVIGGNVGTSLAGGVSVNSGAVVTGTITTDAPPQQLQDVTQAELDLAEATSAAGTGITGSYTYNSGTKAFETSGTVNLAGGVYYFSSLVLKNSATLTITPGAKVTIYVDGDIEIKNSGGINDGGTPENLMILSTGDLVLKNGGNMFGVFYSPNATCDLRNSGAFYGAIVANDIIGHNSANFHYDRNLGNITRGTSDDIAVVGWHEI
jgi:hypothetical protein